MNRRMLLQSGALVAAGSFLPGWARRALAQEGPRGRVLVFLFLRGALDGLHAVPPLGEPRLFDLRPQLAPGPEERLGLGQPGFALHAALEPLLPFWRDRMLAIVHAVGSPDGTRSHFDAQDALELGTPGLKSTPDGWLSRSLRQSMPADRSPLDAVAVSPRLPRSLQGAPSALAFSSLEQLRLHALAGSSGPSGRSEAKAAFAGLYGSQADEPVATSGKEAFAALRMLERKLGPTDTAAEYPQGPLAQSLRQLARLIKADVGLRVGCVDAQGWDTHVAQPARLAGNLRQLAGSLAAFQRDLGPRARDVVLVAATEFGRTVRQNGANGTDHGHGSVAFVLGPSVRGGAILGRWPGLRDDQLYEGRDLAVTTDLRSVLAAVARSQLGAGDARRVFPGFTGQPLSGLL
ncbi:MAG TPA: DUF1501 domain-containing protein [Myxococcales bacterium]|nr:DUF1501 domain-containing protein [Myxococcales bacterium]